MFPSLLEEITGQGMPTVRLGAEERTFGGARLDVLIFRLRSELITFLYRTVQNVMGHYFTKQ